MKRLNPDTGKPFVRGDTRADGFLFSSYKLYRKDKNGFFKENWTNPETLKRQTSEASQRKSNITRIRKSTIKGHIAVNLQRTAAHAKRNGIPFDLSVDYLLSIAPEYCPALGIKLGWCESSGKPEPHSPSLDKRIPELGYVTGNVQWLSYKANAMKRDASLEELKRFALWALQQSS